MSEKSENKQLAITALGAHSIASAARRPDGLSTKMDLFFKKVQEAADDGKFYLYWIIDTKNSIDIAFVKEVEKLGYRIRQKSPGIELTYKEVTIDWEK